MTHVGPSFLAVLELEGLATLHTRHYKALVHACTRAMLSSAIPAAGWARVFCSCKCTCSAGCVCSCLCSRPALACGWTC